MAEASRKIDRRLRPEHPVIFVSQGGVAELPPRTISLDNVGQKTFGLAALPPAWTLPFFSVSAELFQDYSVQQGRRTHRLTPWTKRISGVAKQIGIQPNDEILVRSSGRSEGMAERGKFYSASGVMHDLGAALRSCLEQLTRDTDLRNEEIPLLIQKRCSPMKTKGHLSNERLCYEESRDWMGQFEAAESDRASQFQINLRRWRNQVPVDLDAKLSCELSTHISEVLKTPAYWASQKQARVHFEWAWDGRTVYLVQADEEVGSHGHDPIEEHNCRHYQAVVFTPKVIKRVTAHAAVPFGKISNVLKYLKLGLPSVPLYILDDPKIIKELSCGNVPSGLRLDLAELVKGSLVIRTDIATDDLNARQLLPRTDEIREVDVALGWIIEQSKTLSNSGHNTAFIFHNFIPAQSAAFAYADPKLPFVQIVSLWGLPEGLYYNSHDQYMVDTLKADITLVSAASIPRFPVQERRHFKRFFVSTTEKGNWETLTLKAPFDWKGSLSAEDARQIAYESRRIATADDESVSIMWFIGVPKEIAPVSLIPWYHEPYDLTLRQPSLTTRTKTPFDKCFVIRSTQDVEQLKSGFDVTTPQNRIRIQPSEERLLRDKNTLRKIGELAKDKGATIVLEGATLSHAYYQLLGTGAHVEVVHPFIGFEERHEFNKLVRDRVPELIRERGERVTIARLNEEAIIRALRQKLVEEAYEVLDAKDLESVLVELADLREVVDSLIQHLKASSLDVADQQVEKRNKLGSFNEGIVLLETESLPPTLSPPKDQPHLEGLQTSGIDSKTIDETEFRRRSDWVERRPDRRIAPGKIELRVSVSVPITKSDWSANTAEELVSGPNAKTITGYVKGARNGSQWNYEISVSIDDAQPDLFGSALPPIQSSPKQQPS
jgi:predicted house-cleaning noncanonical NTP pyrophosphatase (MazG superfamily)